LRFLIAALHASLFEAQVNKREQADRNQPMQRFRQ
jgi:hypothetical protein